jgi:hypothetical protein
MANGLDLSGGLVTTINPSEFGVVHPTLSTGGAFVVSGAPTGLATSNLTPGTPVILSIPGGNFNDSTQVLKTSFLASQHATIRYSTSRHFPITTSHFTSSTRHGNVVTSLDFATVISGPHLVGWNEDGLLFENTLGTAKGTFFLIGDPNGTFNPDGSPANTVFGTNTSDAPFGLAVIPEATPCFAAGTRIATADGAVAVEDLTVGTEVLTASGARRPVIWIGHKTVRPARHPRPHEVNPVRIRKGAFAEGAPARDLVVSPGHAVFVAQGDVGGVLIPAHCLINGATIVQEEVETIRYFHVELDAHDVLLAEGLACESYLDDGNRAIFANGGQAVELHGRLDPKSWENACAPWVEAGPQLDAARRGLHARAEALGWERSNEPDLRLVVDGAAIAPLQVAGGRAWFQVPACAELTLASNASVLAQVAPGLPDLRRLGVAVSELRVNGAALGLDDAAFGAGFHALETHGQDAWRWTDGEATLALGLDAPAIIEVAFPMVAPSWKRRAVQLKLVRMAG